MRIKIKVENNNLQPSKTHNTDAGWDLKSTERVVIPVGEVHLMHTGVQMAIPKNNMGLVAVRSSLGKLGLTMTNSVGIIDSDYRGEIMVNVINNGAEDIVIKKLDRFAQIVIMPINLEVLELTDILPATDRGEGGFGSTNGQPIANGRQEKIPVIEPNVSNKKLSDLSPSDYVRLGKKKIKELYPESVGNIKDDLNMKKEKSSIPSINPRDIL